MEAIRINVNKQMDGYSFSLTPSNSNLIKTLFPDAQPANGIFVAYDTKSDFELYVGRLESHIYPLLLGIDKGEEFTGKVHEILFIDTKTGDTIATLKP